MSDREVQLTVDPVSPSEIHVLADGAVLLKLATPVALELADEITLAAEGRIQGRRQ